MSERAGDVLLPLSEWLARGEGAALAMVTKTWGSAPRPVGSLMAVRGDGAFAGSVSGGCVEGAVISEAQNAVSDGLVRNLDFGVANEDAWAVGLACGGTIGIHVAPVKDKTQRALLESLARAAEAHRPAVLASDLASGEWRLIFPDEDKNNSLSVAAVAAARHDESGQVSVDGRDWFLSVVNPPPELVIIGAVHMAQPLSHMAQLAGYRVRVIDPRTRFATEERFPGVALVTEWPDEALAKSPLGPRSAVVALTHDPKLDDPALIAALKSSAFHIGALGSKKTHARRLERLKEAGFSAADVARIHGPVGLDIGARTPAEIAIAILGEIVATLHGK
jgi:xanthine dehydrogenase accessory factor